MENYVHPAIKKAVGSAIIPTLLAYIAMKVRHRTKFGTMLGLYLFSGMNLFLGCNVGAEGGYTCEPLHRRTGPTESKRMFIFMFQPCSKRCIGKVKGQRTSNGIFRKVITQFAHCVKKRHLDFFA